MQCGSISMVTGVYIRLPVHHFAGMVVYYNCSWRSQIYNSDL